MQTIETQIINEHKDVSTRTSDILFCVSSSIGPAFRVRFITYSTS